ncbi:MAG: porphobilinogen synthase [Bacteroidales bacterium]|nr:porphobilinogen synthase [Bacteroidales bacterium]
MAFPDTRLRRLRYNKILRNMVTETHLRVEDLVYPLFVCPGEKVKNPISSMPGNYQMSVDVLVEECKKAVSKGVKSVLLFGIPEHKDEHGHVACQSNGIVQKAIRAIKAEIDDILIIADVCNCEYTTHGHCGTIVGGDVDNEVAVGTACGRSRNARFV